MELWTTLAISFAVQILFFIVAASLKTDKVTDLSYGISFIVIALYLAFVRQFFETWILSVVVIIWGIRLASYLFIRILHMKSDARFDGIREHFWKFAGFWFFQAIVVWLISLPVTIGTAWLLWPGVVVAFAGILIESVADYQKFQFKKNNRGFTHVGLWKYSRHPNYFGELLVWWGLFVAVLPGLQGWQWFALFGPITITILLLFITGIPTVESRMKRKYGKDPKFRKHVTNTRLLVPLP